MGPLLKVMEERDKEKLAVSCLQAEIKAAAKAPAQFRRITKQTEITVPCVMARWDGTHWWAMVIYVESAVSGLRNRYTHWLPFQWPEVRG